MPEPMTLADHSPRSAAVLFTRALGQLDRVEPAALREPIRDMLAAGIERCTISTSLLGQPVMGLIAMAQALVDEVGSHEH